LGCSDVLNTLSTVTYDPAGYVEIRATGETTPGETRRRVNRVATLDGGTVVNDGGYSEADRIIEIAWASDDAAIDASVDRMVQLYTRLCVSVRSGLYLAAPEVYTPGAAQSTLRLLVLSKISV
jgi:hypothetical protein